MKPKTLNVTQRWIFEIEDGDGDGDGEQSVDHIPQDLIEIILPNLPVKSLLRFKCGSKSWRSLIDSKTFIRKHLQNSQRRGALNEFCSFVYDECRKWQIYKPIKDPLTSGSIVGFCNGLLCILKNGCFFICNLATKISLSLPILEHRGHIDDYGERRCGFGWDEETDAYKVFVHSYPWDKGLGHVYSSMTKSWKKVDCGRVYDCGTHHLYNVGVLASGKLHWVPERGVEIPENEYSGSCIIEYFDLKSEVFGRIELPSEPERGIGRWWLRERDGCLEALYYHKDDDKRDRRYKVWLNMGYDNLRRKEREREKRRRSRLRRRGGEEEEEREEEEEAEGEILDVWVMEEYGVKESWVKRSSITLPNPKFTLEYQQYVYAESLISPISEVRCS